MIKLTCKINFCLCNAIGTGFSVTWCQQHHCISEGQYGRNEVQHDFSCHGRPLALMLPSHDAVSILNVTITLLRSRLSKLDEAWLSWSCDMTATGTDIIWCQWFWCHMMPLVSVSVSHNANSIINCTTAFHRSRQLKLDATWTFWVPVSASHYAHASSKAALHFQGQENQWGAIRPFFVMQCIDTSVTWCQMVLWMAPLYFWGQGNQDEVQHDFFGNEMPLAPASASCDSPHIINDTIAFLRSRQLKWAAT